MSIGIFFLMMNRRGGSLTNAFSLVLKIELTMHKYTFSLKSSLGEQNHLHGTLSAAL